jgi:polyhydroxybutyrate depolymerase
MMKCVNEWMIAALTVSMCVACGEQAGSVTPKGDLASDMTMNTADAMGSADMGAARDMPVLIQPDVGLATPDARPDVMRDQAINVPDEGAPDMLMPRDVDRTDIVFMEREVPVYLPVDYDNSTRIPLVVALHGFATSGSYIDNYLELEELTVQRDVAVLIPEGRRNLTLSKYWSATDGCCSNQSLERLEDDDVLFLRDVIEQAKQRYEISAVYVIGHSNGGFMSYRMACDAADLVDGIMSLAGATFDEQSRCAPSRPVKILQVHGTADVIIPIRGSALRGIPPADTTIAYWSEYNQCAQGPDEREDALDLLSGANPDTDVITYTGCAGGSHVTLWKIPGSGHNPALKDDFMARVLDHLEQ